MTSSHDQSGSASSTAKELNDSSRSDAHGVIIGIDVYRDPSIPDLRYARADAEGVYKILTDPELGRFNPANVECLLDEQATERAIKTAIGTRLTQRASENDLVYVYYAGHGAPVILPNSTAQDGLEKYLIPHNAELNNLRGTALSMDDIQKWFGWIESRQVLFFIDSCYSGVAGGRTFEHEKYQHRAALSDEFLDRFAGEGRCVVTACGVNEVSLESKDLGHGIFTYYLMEGMKGAADSNGDGLVTIQELYDYLYRKVSEQARILGGSMRPIQKGFVQGLVYLTQYETDAQKQARQLDQQASKLLEAGQRSAARDLWQKALDLVPKHKNASIGLRAINKREEEKRARLDAKRRVLLHYYQANDLPLEEYNRGLQLIGKKPEDMDETEAKIFHFIDLLTDKKIAIPVFLESSRLLTSAVSTTIITPPSGTSTTSSHRVEEPQKKAESSAAQMSAKTSNTWYVRTGDRSLGPFSHRVIIEKIDAGLITAHNLLSPSDDGNWREAKRLKTFNKALVAQSKKVNTAKKAKKAKPPEHVMETPDDEKVHALAESAVQAAGLTAFSPWRWIAIGAALSFWFSWYATDDFAITLHGALLLPLLCGWLCIKYGVRAVKLVAALAIVSVFDFATSITDTIALGIGVKLWIYVLCFSVAVAFVRPSSLPLFDNVARIRAKWLAWIGLTGVALASVSARTQYFLEVGPIFAYFEVNMLFVCVLVLFCIRWKALLSNAHEYLADNHSSMSTGSLFLWIVVILFSLFLTVYTEADHLNFQFGARDRSSLLVVLCFAIVAWRILDWRIVLAFIGLIYAVDMAMTFGPDLTAPKKAPTVGVSSGAFEEIMVTGTRIQAWGRGFFSFAPHYLINSVSALMLGRALAPFWSAQEIKPMKSRMTLVLLVATLVLQLPAYHFDNSHPLTVGALAFTAALVWRGKGIVLMATAITVGNVIGYLVFGDGEDILFYVDDMLVSIGFIAVVGWAGMRAADHFTKPSGETPRR